jgi:hypothetical protein
MTVASMRAAGSVLLAVVLGAAGVVCDTAEAGAPRQHGSVNMLYGGTHMGAGMLHRPQSTVEKEAPLFRGYSNSHLGALHAARSTRGIMGLASARSYGGLTALHRAMSHDSASAFYRSTSTAGIPSLYGGGGGASSEELANMPKNVAHGYHALGLTQAVQAESPIGDGGRVAFRGKGAGENLDFVYGAETVPTGAGADNFFCGTPNSFTREMLREAAVMVSDARAVAAGRVKTASTPAQQQLSEPEFVKRVTVNPLCLIDLFTQEQPTNAAVSLGSVVAFEDTAVEGGRRFAIASNRSRCGSEGAVDQFLWIYLDDGFPAVSSCSTLAGVAATIGASSVIPITVFVPRI